MKIKFDDLYKLNKKVEIKLLNKFKKLLRKSEFIGGEQINKFERNFQKINNSKYCISCANGSDALVIALKSLGIKKGDEVITTSFSWIATSAAITRAGGKVVFCDIEEDSFNISPKEIEKKISSKTVGIIPVHLYGYPANMDKIMKIAKKNKIWVIEDCAQAHLAEIRGKKVGNFGDIGTFSFYPGKNLGALGDAGCLVTNNKKIAIKSRLIANHGGKGKHLLEGMNSRMDAIQASFLNIKLNLLKTITKKRIKNSKIYFEKLKHNKKIILPLISIKNRNVFHQFAIRVKKRNILKKYLFKKGVETQIHYKKILPLLPAYKKLGHKKQEFPNSYKASRETLSLPISQDKKFVEMDKIIKLIDNFN